MKECGNCTYKYSCGYSSIRVGKDTGECIEPRLFEKKKNGLLWSYKQQALRPEDEVVKEQK